MKNNTKRLLKLNKSDKELLSLFSIPAIGMTLITLYVIITKQNSLINALIGLAFIMLSLTILFVIKKVFEIIYIQFIHKSSKIRY